MTSNASNIWVEAEIKNPDQAERLQCSNESLATADTMFHSDVKKFLDSSCICDELYYAKNGP